MIAEIHPITKKYYGKTVWDQEELRQDVMSTDHKVRWIVFASLLADPAKKLLDARGYFIENVNWAIRRLIGDHEPNRAALAQMLRHKGLTHSRGTGAATQSRLILSKPELAEYLSQLSSEQRGTMSEATEGDEVLVSEEKSGVAQEGNPDSGGTLEALEKLQAQRNVTEIAAAFIREHGGASPRIARIILEAWGEVN